MIRYELKKIFNSKLNIIAMLLGIVLVIVVFISRNFGDSSIYCEESDSYLKGKAGIEYSREKAAKQGTVLTEEMVLNYLKKAQSYEGDLNSDDAYVDLIRKDGPLFYYLFYSYSDITPTYDFNLLKRIDFSKGAGFYQRRIDKINDYLNMDFSFGNYSEKEKEFWRSKANKVKTPFAWESRVTPNMYYDLVSISFYYIFIIVVCLSPIFSKESDTGASQLLLSTKYGKNGLVKAKIIAAMIFGIGYILFLVIFSCLLEAAVSGFQGMTLPVQLMENAIPYALNMWQLCILSAVIVIIIAITIISIILLVSAFTKSSIGTMCIATLLMVVPAFIPYSKESRLFNHILDLTFIRLGNIKEVMIRFVDYTFGPVVIDQITMCFIVWLVLSVICLIPTRRVFVNRIIKN